jgi:Flp pilus assembly protein TadG
MLLVPTKLRTDETGSELVEVALTLSLLLMVLFAIISFAWMMYADHYVANAAQAAVRYALVRGPSCVSTTVSDCPASATDIENYVTSNVPPGISANNLTVNATICSPSSSNLSCKVQVTVTYKFQLPVLSFLTAGKTNAVTLTGSSAASVSQ